MIFKVLCKSKYINLADQSHYQLAKGYLKTIRRSAGEKQNLTMTYRLYYWSVIKKIEHSGNFSKNDTYNENKCNKFNDFYIKSGDIAYMRLPEKEIKDVVNIIRVGGNLFAVPSSSIF